ncbi:endonuclease V [Candidatus Nitromaritima sp. SCGC AAA799-C22]|nr:endonuclease V [Candidatus Nitromaritima sp. SCGC AAA799-C22]
MKIKNLHSWDVTPKEAARIQEQLAGKITLSFENSTPKIIAGADISFSKGSTTAYAGIVLLSFPSLEIIGEYGLSGPLRFPYIPGLLSFREAPLLLKLFRHVDPAPDLVFFDGQGLAHPRRFGLACHIGLFLDRPAIGCAKSKLIGNYREPGKSKGSSSKLTDDDNHILGNVLRSRQDCKPVFVSPGHKIDVPTATKYALECCTRYRIPEPTRLAHLLVNKLRKAQH